MVAVELAGVSFSYGQTRVLAGVDLAIAPGELFLLLGPSGCGKTTLLRLVAGFIEPSAGQVRIGGVDAVGTPTERRGLGMVFQNYALWPHLDVAGNVAFPLEMAGVPSGDRPRRVAEALELVALAGFGGRRIGELSGGQQQRVALARAIVGRPKVLLLDEPLSNLDAHLRTELRGEIRRVCKASGVTALYVTHDQAEALSVADRIALVLAGRIAQVGTPHDLYTRPGSVAAASFLGSANLLPGTMAGPSQADCCLGRLDVHPGPGLTPGGACMVMIRPEHLRVSASGTEARIISGDYHGPANVWSVEAGGQRLLWSESPARGRQPGDTLGLAVEPGAAVALAP